MNALLQDLRFAVRMLRKNPGFSMIAVVALALGIGANTAVFSVIDATLLHPFPYKDADQLVLVRRTVPEGNLRGLPLSAPSYDFFRTQGSSFQSIAASRNTSFNLSGSERPEQVPGAVVTASLFDLAGVNPLLGRPVLPTDEGNAANRVLVLSEGLWRRRFGGNSNIVGQIIDLNGEKVTVVGVMPAAFQLPQSAQAWLSPKWKLPEHPLRPNQDPLSQRGSNYLRVFARVKPGVSHAQLQAELERMSRQIEKDDPNGGKGAGAEAVSLRDDLFGNLRPILFVLLGAVAFVLLISCANVANLLLARASYRQREIALRTALGASRARIVAQLLTESVLLSGAGAVLGLLIAYWAIPPMMRLSPTTLSATSNPHLLNGQVLIFTAVTSILTGLLFGLFPALQASKQSVSSFLKESGNTTTASNSNKRFRSALVILEIGISVVLLVSAGLMINGFVHLMHVNPGFDPDHLLTMGVSLPPANYPDAEAKAAFYSKTLDQLRVLPGVVSAANTTDLPMTSANSGRGINIPGQPQTDLTSDLRVATPDYFRTMHIAVLRGREFQSGDTSSSQPVTVVNETLARQMWPNQDAIGKTLQANGEPPNMQVVGVVADIKHFGLDDSIRPEYYTPTSQGAWPSTYFIVRTSTDPEALATAAMKAVWNVDSSQAVANVGTMEQLVYDSMRERRFSMVLLGIFASVSLLLAAAGIYGVVSYAVTQRTHEIGIRMALGASRARVLSMVMRQSVLLMVIGLAAGLIASLFMTRLLSTLLFGIKPTDPLTFASVTLVLGLVAMAASYVPARRATRVDPMVALRYE